MRATRQLGIVRRIEPQAPLAQALDLSGSQRRHAISPLGNSAFGNVQLPRNLSAGAEELDGVIGEHVVKFSALDIKSKTAELVREVGYSPMMSSHSEERGKRIKAQRKMKRLTQQQLADRIGVSKGLISQWEKGQIEKITHPNWMALLGELTVDAEALEFGPDEPRSTPGEGAGKWRKRRG